MNFNASRNVSGGALRKAKRVSDVAAMGVPSPSGYNPAGEIGGGYPGAPPPYQEYQESVPVVEPQHQQPRYASPSPAPAQDFNYAAFAQSPIAPTQIGSMLQQPIVQDMAMQYGSELVSQGKAAVARELGAYLPVSRLRYYFAVDTRYVLRKLLLIMFPFTHKDWMVKYSQDAPVQPRYDLNAPDLYIPSMGYVTYVLLAGFMLGIQHRFSPEQIGIQASSALAYILFEMVLYLATLYVTSTSTSLGTLDLLAYSGYKYSAMLSALLAGLLLGRAGYYCSLLYTSFALSYFLVKTLRVQVLSGQTGAAPQPAGYGYGPGPAGYAPAGYAPAGYAPAGYGAAAGGGGTKRRVYFLLFVAVTQPFLTWWLTYHLVPAAPVAAALPAR